MTVVLGIGLLLLLIGIASNNKPLTYTVWTIMFVLAFFAANA